MTHTDFSSSRFPLFTGLSLVCAAFLAFWPARASACGVGFSLNVIDAIVLAQVLLSPLFLTSLIVCTIRSRTQRLLWANRVFALVQSALAGLTLLAVLASVPELKTVEGMLARWLVLAIPAGLAIWGAKMWSDPVQPEHFPEHFQDPSQSH